MYSVSERDRLRAGRCDPNANRLQRSRDTLRAQRCRGRARRPVVDTGRRMPAALSRTNSSAAAASPQPTIRTSLPSSAVAAMANCSSSVRRRAGSPATSSRPFSRRASHGIAMMRSLRMRSPGSWLIRFCSTLRTPIARHGTTTPGCDDTSQSSMASRGSPSAACVDGTHPQSKGYVRPHGSGRDTDIACHRGSYLSLSDVPRGASTTM
jgi:hypothetical protein